MLALIMVAQATQAAVQQGIPAIGPLLQARHHLDLSQTGLALSAVPLGILCTMLVWGFVADRVGSRYMVATSLIGTAGGLILASNGEFAGLLAGLLVTGMFGGGLQVGLANSVTRNFSRGQHGLAFGLRQMAVPVGGAIAAAVLPWIAVSQRPDLVLYALALLPAVVATGALVHATRITVQGASPMIPPPRGQLLDIRLRLLFAGTFLYACVQSCILTYTVLFLHSASGWTIQASGLALAAIQVFGAVGRLGFGILSDNRPRRSSILVLIGCAAGLGIGVGVLTSRSGSNVSLAFLLPSAVLAISYNAIPFALASGFANSQRLGMTFGLMNTMSYAAAAMSPLFFAKVVAEFGWDSAWASLPFLSISGAAIFAVLMRHERSPSRVVQSLE